MKKFLKWAGGTAIRLFCALGPVIFIIISPPALAYLLVMAEVFDLALSINRKLTGFLRELYTEQKKANRRLVQPAKPAMFQVEYKVGLLTPGHDHIIPILYKRKVDKS